MQFSTAGLGSFGKARRRQFGVGSALFVFFIGAIFTGVSSLLLQSEINSRNWPTTKGHVVYVSERLSSDSGMVYTPTVAYSVNGTQYKVTSSITSSNRETIGNEKTVRYNPHDPRSSVVALSGTSYFVYLFPIMGVLLIIGSIVGFMYSLKRSAAIKRLKQSGIKLRGVVTNVENMSQGSSVKLIVSAADQSGQVHDYKSDSVGGNTFALINYRTNPVAMDVYVDTGDPNNYYVDLDDVPAMTVESIQQLLSQATNKPPFGNTPTMSAAPQTASQTAPVTVSNPTDAIPPFRG